jgi:hypothetical protein
VDRMVDAEREDARGMGGAAISRVGDGSCRRRHHDVLRACNVLVVSTEVTQVSCLAWQQGIEPARCAIRVLREYDFTVTEAKIIPLKQCPNHSIGPVPASTLAARCTLSTLRARSIRWDDKE